VGFVLSMFSAVFFSGLLFRMTARDPPVYAVSIAALVGRRFILAGMNVRSRRRNRSRGGLSRASMAGTAYSVMAARCAHDIAGIDIKRINSRIGGSPHEHNLGLDGLQRRSFNHK
jgi:hypothetical protein